MFTSNKQSGNPNKSHTDQAYYKLFLLFLKRNNSQTFKSIATAKNLFSSVYVIGTACFDKLFLFHVTTGRQYFL